MAIKGRILFLLSVLLALEVFSYNYVNCLDDDKSVNCECFDRPVERSSFPDGFLFGAAGAAYQFEGAYNKDGKGLSNWDYYTHEHPEMIIDGSNGDVAANSYSQYKEDVRIAKDMGLDAYRFSISWARILPHGKLFGGRLNPKGLEYYNNLIDELLLNGNILSDFKMVNGTIETKGVLYRLQAFSPPNFTHYHIFQGIEPHVTLFHWDVPLTLDQQYGGFLSRRIVEDFRYYADICFKHYGDRVKNWITLNEPWSVSDHGYSVGTNAPGRCSNHSRCLGGDSGTEPYMVSHNFILAHAAATQLYRQKYQACQNGSIGITLNSHWFLPYSNSTADQLAQKRALDFVLGWFLDPLVFGTYPKSMIELVGNRLPTFTPSELRMIKGSFDFIGLNYYTTYYATATPHDASKGPFSYETDSQLTCSGIRDGIPIGKQSDADWLFVYPKGLQRLLDYMSITYNDPPIVITENGICEANNPSMNLEDALNDSLRVDYMHEHLCCLLDAIKGGGQIKGYFAWSLLDNYEWAYGYTVRFGLNYVDFKNKQKRYPKRSASWYKQIISREHSLFSKNMNLLTNNHSVLSSS